MILLIAAVIIAGAISLVGNYGLLGFSIILALELAYLINANNPH